MLRIAILGTFDLRNYGDLLFPLVARHELERRLGGVELIPFSYHAKEEADWPYRVHSIADLPARLRELDGLIVGGGHLVRFDTAVADGYGPPPGIDHPTGLWLMPALLAAAGGLPVVWNAVGASPDVDEWAAPLLRAALESSALVTVRDRPSQATLRALSGGTEVAVVPDTAFGLAPLLDEPELAGSFTDWRSALGIEEPYVVAQGCEQLLGVGEPLEAQLRELAARGYGVVELPIGPVLDDRTGLVAPAWDDVVRIDEWPSPLRLAQLVAHAEAAIGYSLHLGITALCHGVPLHRPRCWPGLKYEILGRFPGVFQFDDYGREPRLDLEQGLGRRPVSAEVEECTAQLAEHWDRVAAALAARAPAPPPAVGGLLFGLPETLRRAAGVGTEPMAGNPAEAETGGESETLRQALGEEQSANERLREALVEQRRAGEELQTALAGERATVEELHGTLSEIRRLSESERSRLEAELQAADGHAADLARRFDAASGVLEEIGRSRAFRFSNRLQRLYETLVHRPWQAVRRRLRRAP